MKILKRLLDVYSLKQQVEALEASLQSKDEFIHTIEEEKAAVNKRLENLIFRYRDIDSRIAGMNFKLYQLTQANKILTMKLTGTTAQRDALQSWLKRMKERGHGGES